MAEKSISEKRRDKMATKAAENAAGLTTADKLTRASKEETAKVPIKYSEGDFDIEVRLAMVSEQDAIKRMIKKVTPEDPSVASEDQIDQEMAEMLARHSIDESLDVEFWALSNFSPGIFLRVFYAILGVSEEKVQAAQEVLEAQSFRKNRDGAGAVAAMR